MCVSKLLRAREEITLSYECCVIIILNLHHVDWTLGGVAFSGSLLRERGGSRIPRPLGWGGSHAI